jgi:O-acetyl-ADP-ribose deacetylase (regulator of RNase III)
MIKAVRKGDLFDSGAQTLVNTVNTVGVMGKGIALEFKRRYPDMFADYQRRCAEGAVRLGEPYLWRGLLEPWIVNFPTKEHWRSASRIDDVERGLRFLADHLEQWGVASLAVPPLGAGSGGLDWLSIGPTLYRHLEALPIPVLLYVPFDVPDEQATIAFLAARERPMDGAEKAAHANGRLQPGWMVIAEIVRRINQIRYAWPVGRIRLQKIAYFATMAGVPSGFQYVEGSYGPFTPDLGPALGRLINNGVIVERPIGRMLAVRPGPTFDDAYSRYQEAIQPHEATIDRVVDLLVRLDSRRTEIAASVHFAAGVVATEVGRPPSEREVLERVQRWKQRRRPPLEEPEIVMAIRGLAALGWIDVTRSNDLPPYDEMVTVA